MPTVIVATDTFVQFARRIASTQGFPHIVIANTPNPLRHFDNETMRKRAEDLMPAIIDGLTSPTAEIVRRVRDIARAQIHPTGIVRSSTPV